MRFNVLRSWLQHAPIHENVAVQMQVSLVLPRAVRDLHGAYRGIHLQITLLPTYDVYIFTNTIFTDDKVYLRESGRNDTRETCRSHIQYICHYIQKRSKRYNNNNCVSSDVFVDRFDRDWFCKILSAISWHRVITRLQVSDKNKFKYHFRYRILSSYSFILACYFLFVPFIFIF